MLPDERELGHALGATRNVIREALALLRDEGLIVRRRGIGTRVVTAKYGHGLERLTGLAETLVDHGTVTNEVRAARIVPHAPKAVTERLRLLDGSGAVYLERLRSLDGRPPLRRLDLARPRHRPAPARPRSGPPGRLRPH
ncbi:GntR family transcriptional regulator [Streptomyces sp. NBC_00118]|uniref:GntR family transcriptional regulator n=1 Tax=unclassified Streptomyces TaxID=2593676 RepID=UPI0032565AB7